MKELYRAIRKHLQHDFVQTSYESHFRVLATMFQQLHGISYIIGTIDGLHIHVLALVVGGECYYSRKSFHTTILQRIVGLICMIWNYKFGWV